MPVWFVYRSFDLGPTGKHVRRFEDDTVLGWFQSHWEHLAIADRDKADDRLEEAVGCDGWFLWNPFHTAAEQGIPCPSSNEELMQLIGGSVDEFRSTPRDLQVFTEEDGEGGALYYFDGHFLAKSGARAAYLLNEDWRLPSGHAEGGFAPAVETEPFSLGGTGPGATYAVFLVRESKYPLDDLMPAYRFDGLRLPELPARLLASSPTDDWPGYLRSLPALMLAGVEMPDALENAFLTAIRSNPADATTWAAWADWREERGREPPGIGLLRSAFARLARLPGEVQDRLHLDRELDVASGQLLETEQRAKLRADPKSLIHVEEHLAQMCIDGSWSDEPYFGQWIFFDDLWASAHPDLANAILCFAARWDVLSRE